MVAGVAALVDAHQRLAGGPDLVHLPGLDAEHCGDLLLARHPSVLLFQTPRHAFHPVRLLHAVDRQPHGVGLLGDRLLDRLPDPPDRVGDEAELAPFVEAFRRRDQTDVAFGDQVHVAQAMVEELLGHADHEAQIRADESIKGLLVAPTDGPRQLELRLPGQQLEPADGPQIVLQARIVTTVSGQFHLVHVHTSPENVPANTSDLPGSASSGLRLAVRGPDRQLPQGAAAVQIPGAAVTCCDPHAPCARAASSWPASSWRPERSARPAAAPAAPGAPAGRAPPARRGPSAPPRAAGATRSGLTPAGGWLASWRCSCCRRRRSAAWRRSRSSASRRCWSRAIRSACGVRAGAGGQG